MKNQYFGMRHGQSKANVAELIVSSTAGLLEDFTLTKEGEEQVEKSLFTAKIKGLLDTETVVYSSPFSRAKRSAELARDVLKAKYPIHVDDRLRERWFGDFERSHASNYKKVWEEDHINPHHKDFNVESVYQVLERMGSLLRDIEEQYSWKTILLVSHGDPLQILQTSFLGKSPAEHRHIVQLDVAEIRHLTSF